MEWKRGEGGVGRVTLTCMILECALSADKWNFVRVAISVGVQSSSLEVGMLEGEGWEATTYAELGVTHSSLLPFFGKVHMKIDMAHNCSTPQFLPAVSNFCLSLHYCTLYTVTFLYYLFCLCPSHRHYSGASIVST